tara:strand:- start:38 stop:466 length:429 start_codon:yes stop_codon:yes gene_type:complete
MKKQLSIFFLLFFISANINAEISGVDIRDLTQLYKEQITKILAGNKLFGHYDDGDYRGSVEEIHYKNGDYEIIADGTIYRGKWKTLNNQICYKQSNWIQFECVLVYVGFNDGMKLYFVEKVEKSTFYDAGMIYEEIYKSINL